MTTATMVYIGIDSAMSGFGFGPEYETEIINQEIGGKLICESVYNADHHSWQFNIDYKYINQKGDTIDFSNGGYYGREWNKDEQIRQLNDWLILKTGAWHGSDRIILRNNKTNKIVTYDIDNQFIERQGLWQKQNIESLLNYCCAESFVKTIKNNEIIVDYKYRTKEKEPDEYGKRQITFEIDEKSGDLTMKKITNANAVYSK
ncbi:hypothetical protein [Hwangdonia lutea]|uniref:Uncharacterized protein n=1 Tax=Hwangdonia lutea TaxID=3075823 RepID=A0AA97ENB3_9FLAO|nr:hypothetical protein [Hwangdonia sp. SCSIO 19198]WOD43624.1 hypothetical protein RNZ46_16690 [Hwangdonia sp. SCSIO 19198]